MSAILTQTLNSGFLAPVEAHSDRLAVGISSSVLTHAQLFAKAAALVVTLARYEDASDSLLIGCEIIGKQQPLLGLLAGLLRGHAHVPLHRTSFPEHAPTSFQRSPNNTQLEQTQNITSKNK